MYYMWNADFPEFISSWQQCFVARPCTDPFFKATFPSSHDTRKKTVQTLTPLSDVRSIVATGNTTDVAAMVVAD
jgi:hypothetical protein